MSAECESKEDVLGLSSDAREELSKTARSEVVDIFFAPPLRDALGQGSENYIKDKTLRILCVAHMP